MATTRFASRLIVIIAAAIIALASVQAWSKGDSESATGLGAICSPKRIDEPCARASVEVEYPTTVLSHCGVEWIYFDGRYWVIDPPQPEGANLLPGVAYLPPRSEVLFFTADGGRRFKFERAESGYRPPLCY